jgi:hypothetical protein
MMLFNVIACVLQQVAILDATRTSHFAGAASEAEIDVMDGRIAQRLPALLQCSHQVDASAWRIVFIAGFQIRRARRQAKTAMNAG